MKELDSLVPLLRTLILGLAHGTPYGKVLAEGDSMALMFIHLLLLPL